MRIVMFSSLHVAHRKSTRFEHRRRQTCELLRGAPPEGSSEHYRQGVIQDECKTRVDVNYQLPAAISDASEANSSYNTVSENSREADCTLEFKGFFCTGILLNHDSLASVLLIRRQDT